MTLVLNTSPIIMLAKIGLIHKLNTVYKNIVIPYGVSEEILEGGDDEAVRWIKGDGKKHVINFSKVEPVVAAWDLGKGESQVISYIYMHSELKAGLDDKAARKCAKTLSIKLIGTIGLILNFKKNRQIECIKPYLDNLQKNGFRLNQKLYIKALSLANEN